MDLVPLKKHSLTPAQFEQLADSRRGMAGEHHEPEDTPGLYKLTIVRSHGGREECIGSPHLVSTLIHVPTDRRDSFPKPGPEGIVFTSGASSSARLCTSSGASSAHCSAIAAP